MCDISRTMERLLDQRYAGMVRRVAKARCDAVVCPVTCINHQAGQKAKRICKRQDKPFMAVASTGRGTFLRALEELSGRIVATAAAPRPESFA